MQTSGTATAPAASPSAPVVDLVAAVDALAAQTASDLPGEQAVTDATVLLRELERLRGVVLTRIADVDRRDLHQLADAPSTGTWVAAQQTSLTRTEVALARRLAAFPAVRTAVDDGSLSAQSPPVSLRRSSRPGRTSTARTGSSTGSPRSRRSSPSSSMASEAWSARHEAVWPTTTRCCGRSTRRSRRSR